MRWKSQEAYRTVPSPPSYEGRQYRLNGDCWEAYREDYVESLGLLGAELVVPES